MIYDPLIQPLQGRNFSLARLYRTSGFHQGQVKFKQNEMDFLALNSTGWVNIAKDSTKGLINLLRFS